MRIILPEYIRMNDLHEEGHDTIQNYDENKMERFMMYFQELTNRSWYLFEEKFSEIYSKKLQRISGRDYVEYVRLLEAKGLLNIKHYYMHDEQCKMYSYAPIFAEKVFLHKIYRGKKKIFNDRYIILSNNKDRLKNKLEEKLNELFCYLEFDVDGALKFAEYLKEERKKNPDINYFAKGWLRTESGKYYKGIKAQPKDIEDQYKYEMWQIDKWDDRYFEGYRDNTSFRFHSLLTRLPREYKQFISFSGQKLCSLDIKNSQPFFSLVLMNPAFWYYPEIPVNEKKIFEKYFGVQINPLLINLKTIGMESYFTPQNIVKVYKAILNLGDDFHLYRENVLSGNLYELIQQQYQEKLGVKMERNDVKTSLFTTIFSSNKFFGQKDARPKKMFSEAFPTIYKVFSAIKANHKSFIETDIVTKPHQLLSIMLQRIESFIVLDVVVKYLLENARNIPVFTIHDSICSTKEHMPLIQTIFKEKIFECTGITPKFGD